MKQMHDILGTETTATDLILPGYPYVRKRYANWVPHGQTDEQNNRTQWCRFMSHKINGARSK